MRNENSKDTKGRNPGAGHAARRQFRVEIRRTGVTVLALLSDASGLPAELTPRLVNRWLSGVTKQIDPAHAGLVLALYRALPDASPSAGRPISAKRLPLTAAMRAGLEAELVRTCATVASIIDPADRIPPGLSARVIRSWIYGAAKSVCPAHWEFVIARLSARPDATGLVFSRREGPRRDS